LNDVASFCANIDGPALCNALGQTLLRCCCPGVPDTYQGSELWNQSLVDPDNRRPVDYELRRRQLEQLKRAREKDPRRLLSELLESYADGRVKQFVLHVALELRAREPELFRQGDYVPLDGGEHVVAFMRRLGQDTLVCVVPRLTRKLGAGPGRVPLGPLWGERRLAGLAPGKYRDAFTGQTTTLGESAALAELLAEFPLALLTRERA
jgi:(1->4)-alpha-D-glucan 1-alpha-D-glucosylmutase